MTKQQKEYNGSAYVGVVGSDYTYTPAIDSIYALNLRGGDHGPVFHRGTKGYEARQLHLNKWYNHTKHDFLLLLDQDMIFQPDTLEQLRSHRLPFVSGFYLRRRFAPMLPVWYELPPKHKWPMEPLVRLPESGKLYPLGGSGWGCMLLHRDVVTATKPILKGEDEIIEDDMDLWPYDLARVLAAIKGLRLLVDERPSAPTFWPALNHHTTTLEEEIRLLRGKKDVVGSDLRYPFFAREAGFVLMGDPDVRPEHVTDYGLKATDYEAQQTSEAAVDDKDVHKQVLSLRRKIAREMRELEAA